jgi:ribosomal protein L29
MKKKLEKTREFTLVELEKEIDKKKEELFNLRFQKIQGQLENPRKIGEVKKEIARLMTLTKEKELAGEIITPEVREAEKKKTKEEKKAKKEAKEKEEKEAAKKPKKLGKKEDKAEEKEEPKEEPTKEEPKEEPAKEEPKGEESKAEDVPEEKTEKVNE